MIDWYDPTVRASLPDEVAISAITAAELAAGPLLAKIRSRGPGDRPASKKSRRDFEPIPFDAAIARSYGLVAAAASGNRPHPRSRFADLQIAATAHAHRLDLCTRNTGDFDGPEELIRIVAIQPANAR